MKRFLLPAILAFATLQAYSQKISADKVPAPVKSGFASKHPAMKGTWEKEKSNYEVNFKENGKDMSCLIDASGNITETETEIKAQELPQPARDYLQKNYKGVKIKEAAKIVMANGDVQYEAEMNKKDVLFDGKGNFLKVEEKDKD